MMARRETGHIRVGTSGWSYDHWRNAFYPPGTPATRWFEYYSRHFDTVEINATFYRLPKESTGRKWRAGTPEGFRFAVKGSRYITHILRLRDPGDAVEKYWHRLSALAPVIDVVLWQLPPNLERDDALLRDFLAVLPGGVRQAVEFRHRSWLHDCVYDILRERNAGFVAVSARNMPDVRVETADFIYARFHGLTGGYAHNYSDAELRPWREWATDCAEHGLDGYFYFNNDGQARAPENATRFRESLGEVGE